MSDYSFAHLLNLSTSIGTFEHADHREPRPEHGFCTDDMARVLIVCCREENPTPAVRALARTALRFVSDAQGVTGKARNRRSQNGTWSDRPQVADCWGRSTWAFGTAARYAPDDWMRQAALAQFGHAARQRSPWPRSMAFAALGAAEVLALRPHDGEARALLADAVTTIGHPADDDVWRWPEPRLSYANASLAEVLIAAGHLLSRADVQRNGLAMLGWLLDRETFDGHLSPTPVSGAGRDDRGPAFDQQPIEVAAMADACRRAAAVSGDPKWLRGIDLAARWFFGDNDAGAVMFDATSGGGYDGLHERGANVNQGAESTLALISTMQLASHLAPSP